MNYAKTYKIPLKTPWEHLETLLETIALTKAEIVSYLHSDQEPWK